MKEQLLALIATAKEHEAILAIKNLPQLQDKEIAAITLLESRYTELQKKVTNGTCTHEQHTTERNTINVALVEMILSFKWNTTNSAPVHKVYHDYLEYFVAKIDLKNWAVFAENFISSSQYILTEKRLDTFEEIVRYTRSRPFRKELPKLEMAVANLALILEDFLTVYFKYARNGKEDGFYIEKFYKIRHFPEDENQRLLKQYNYHCRLICDFMLEITRAVNLILEYARLYIDDQFELNVGVLSFAYLSKVEKIEYLEHEKDLGYIDMVKFMVNREKRNSSYGKVINEECLNDYFPSY